MPVELLLRAMEDRDWDAVRAIYLEGIATGNATFEAEAPEWEQWNASHRADCRIVACREGTVVGFAALSPVSARRVYAGVAEVSVYVSKNARGGGIGKKLMRQLIAQSEAAGIWTLQAGIFPENLSSLKLHKRVGFRLVGVRESVGQLAGKWRDVALMERRSAKVGV